MTEETDPAEMELESIASEMEDAEFRSPREAQGKVTLTIF